MTYTVVPTFKVATDLVVYDWVVLDEIAYRVTSVKTRGSTVEIEISDGCMQQFGLNEAVTILAPR